MCGIAGILSNNTNKVSAERLKLMTDSIEHRGPDGEGFWLNKKGNVGFGHRRLSIIDLSNAGAQPMQYMDRYTITYNGEIYNYIELKNELKKKGFIFNSRCDTEVILAAYACYGTDCLQHFDGMFAFAIWDEKEQVLFCARDRFGEKPFFYQYDEQKQTLLFASEMKALWAAGIVRHNDEGMVLNYLALGWVQNPVDKQQTFYKTILSLPPAHFLLYNFSNSNALQLTSYWDLDKQAVSQLSPAEMKDQLLQLFTTSIKRRLRSDVAIGSSLSGGLDSSAIVAMIAAQIDNAAKQQTFSAVFPGFEKDESAHIKTVAERYKIENFTVTPTSEGCVAEMQKLAWHQEEPFQSASNYAQYKVYELAKQYGVTVILDGQGADEIFAGYTKYFQWFLQELIANGQWKQAQKELAAIKKNGAPLLWSFKNYIAAFLPGFTARQLENKAVRQLRGNKDISQHLIHSAFNKSSFYKPVVDKLNDLLYFNTMQFGLEELLRYADRNSMAHSREVRLPFLNHDLVQFAFSIPATLKINNGFTKYLLRLAMEQQLPASIVWRKDKVGFEPPQQAWMQQPKMRECIQESRRKLVNAGLLEKVVLEKPFDFKAAHEDKNYDWRYVCAANTLAF